MIRKSIKDLQQMQNNLISLHKDELDKAVRSTGKEARPPARLAALPPLPVPPSHSCVQGHRLHPSQLAWHAAVKR